MSALRQELKNYIDSIPERNLEAVKPILSLLATDYDPDFILEDDLTPEEEAIIEEGRKLPDSCFLTLEEALKVIDG
jgi:hypothetical protein